MKKKISQTKSIPQKSNTVLSEIVFPNMLNHCGTMFGGEALKMMDMAASIIATRYCRKTVVTVFTDQIEFKVPIKQGELVELTGEVIKVGRTSMTVRVDLHTENLLSGERKLCTTGNFVMVAVDKKMKPTPVVSKR